MAWLCVWVCVRATVSEVVIPQAKGDVGGSSPADICQKLSQVLNARWDSKRTWGSGVTLSSISWDSIREQNKNNYSQVWLQGGKKLTHVASDFVHVYWRSHTCPLSNGVTVYIWLRGVHAKVSARWGYRDNKRESEYSGDKQSRKTQSVWIRVTAGSMKTELTDRSKLRWE